MKAILKAIANFQQEVPIIHKDSKGYSYSYTNFASIIEKITPLLKKHGLGFYQPLNDGTIKTIIFHAESGECIESESKLPVDSLEYVQVVKTKKKDGKEVEYNANIILGFEGMNKAQAYGSLITYFRRYALSSILGLVTDTDADARNKRMESNNTELPTLLPNNKEAWIKVKKALINGTYTVDQCRKKWQISKEVETQLQNEIDGNHES